MSEKNNVSGIFILYSVTYKRNEISVEKRQDYA